MDETPILLLSAKADEELKMQLLEASAQDFITKPFSERDLLVRVRNLIAVRQSREILREAEQRRRQEVEAVNRELQERSRQLSDLFEQTPSFMTVLRGSTHVFEFANAAYLRLVGHRQIIGKSVCDALPEIKEQGFIDLLDRVRATGEPYTGTQIPVLVQRVPGAPLEQRYVNIVLQPLIEKNKDAAIFVEGHDVTDQKRAEDSLRVANRRKDEFLATLAHELRNPLAPIRHAAKLSKNKDATKAELEWSHDVVDRQVGHMARLLDDLLDVSRITGGKLEMRKERLALNEILMAAVETVRPLIEARGHRLTTDLPKINVLIDADPVRFEQILSNLLTNSAKYTDRGGLIHIQVTLADGTVQIVVRDNGIGISPELLPHLFDMFSQATPAIDRSEGGLGIGLSLVRGLVLLHGGTVEARSQGIGQGSEFIITFPVASVARVHPVAPPASSNVDHDPDSRMRVLVIDDNRDNADLCTMMFRKGGHEVRTAYAGQEGLDLAAEFLPQFVLLDIGMPQMNGFEVARRIRAAKWGEKITLIAITGWGQEDDKQKARAAGFDHHVTKPFDFKELKKLLLFNQ
jgi:signal transduction histidine kinase